MSTEKTLHSRVKHLAMQNKILSTTNKLLRDKDNQLLHVTDDLYTKLSEEATLPPTESKQNFDGITLVIAAYNLPRFINRTLTSCTPHYQGFKPSEFEVIIVDNGSSTPLKKEDFRDYPFVSQVIRIDGKPSPVYGLNKGIQAAKFSNVGVMIDGAHMLTPGVLQNAKTALQLFKRPVINVPQYILGDFSQNLSSIENAYEYEEQNLEKVGWPQYGYTLFDFCVLPGEDVIKKTFQAIETNCLITTKEVFNDCGAFNELFDEPGAGMANLEIFSRLCNDVKNKYVTLAGEGSFHQNHHGTTTGASREDRDALVKSFSEKHKTVTGKEFSFTFRAPFLLGELNGNRSQIPTISIDYGKARGAVLKELSNMYIDRAKFSQRGPIPSLTLKKVQADERKTRPILNPLGLLDTQDQKAKKQMIGYRDILIKAHKLVNPRKYLEIGIDDGSSLNLSKCLSIGVDPGYELTSSLSQPTQIFRETSDGFFEKTERCKELFSNELDLAFIDGMHLAEYVLRDFINVEKHCAPGCVVIIDDVFPEQIEMAARDRVFNAWCGDVYKIIPILLKYRPDLNVDTFTAFAGPYRKGVSVVSGLDSKNSTLSEKYDQILKEIMGDTYSLNSISDLEKQVPITPVERLDSVLTAQTKNR